MEKTAERVLKECALNEPCAYLDGHDQTTHYKVIEGCSIAQCEALIERGWRRFGAMFFRPVCRDCTACESIKIDAFNYAFSKSARRVIKKNTHLRIAIQSPTMSHEHIALFEKYHDHMQHKRGWDNPPVTAQNYYASFVHAHQEFGYEVLYFDDGKLVGVDLIDILPNGISSIYFYYDPDYANHSLGKYSLYYQIQYAKRHGLRWIYLGYYVEENESLCYKKDFKPHQILQGRPEEDMSPEWQ